MGGVMIEIGNKVAGAEVFESIDVGLAILLVGGGVFFGLVQGQEGFIGAGVLRVAEADIVAEWECVFAVIFDMEQQG